MTNFYNVAMESQDIVIRVSRELFDRDTIIRFLDYLEIEALRQRSKLTQEQADILAKEIEQAGWQNLKESFLKA